MVSIKRNPLRRLHTINRNVGIETPTPADVQCPHFRNRYIQIGAANVTNDFMAECHRGEGVVCEYREDLTEVAVCKRYWKEDLTPAQFLYKSPRDNKAGDWQLLNTKIHYERPFTGRKAEVRLALMKPVKTNISLGNFLTTWKEWYEQQKGNWTYQMNGSQAEILNKENQNGRSFWYNPNHFNLQNYAIDFMVQARGGDDDMYGAIFRYDGTSFYSFEWDSGGMGVNGMAIYRNTPTGKERLAYSSVRWGANASNIHKVNIRIVENKINVKVSRKSGSTFTTLAELEVLDMSPSAIMNGAWGPVTNSQPSTYFWDLQLTNYQLIEGTDVYPTTKMVDLFYKQKSGSLHIVSENMRKEFEDTLNELYTDDMIVELWLNSSNVPEGVQFSHYDKIINSTSNLNTSIAMTTFNYDGAVASYEGTQVMDDRTTPLVFMDTSYTNKSLRAIELRARDRRLFDTIIVNINGIKTRYIPNILQNVMTLEFNPMVQLEIGDTVSVEYHSTDHELSYFYGPAIDTHEKIWSIKENVLGWHKKAERT